jgi:2-isopropylmalate synthase
MNLIQTHSNIATAPPSSFNDAHLLNQLSQIGQVEPLIALPDNLIIFDTTLRDGEQSPGASMTRDEKLRIAKQLEKLRVDVIEAGFAASSKGDFESVQLIANTIKESTVCSLARANEKDITDAGNALKGAASARIHTFIATSALHMEHKLRMTPKQVLQQAIKAVRLARQYTDNIEFSPEDGYRSDPDFLCRVLEAVITEGATTINVPDTVGYAVPELYGNFFKMLRERIPNSDKVIWSAHCHNDLGMAVANSLAAVKIGGARQIECTINGLGERAGNCSLEEVVMAVRTRKDYFNLALRVDATQIVPASRMVSQTTGFVVQPNKAVVGANAFAHTSGIHQDGVLKNRETYEIMRAEDVGWNSNKIVLGKLSGRNAFKQRLQELGLDLSSEQAANEAFLRFKDLADRKSEIYDEDIIALVSDELSQHSHTQGKTDYQDHYHFISLAQKSETGEQPQARIVFAKGEVEHTASSTGNGPVDASLKAIESYVNSGAEMVLYSVNAISGNTESQAEVTVRLTKGGRIVNGVGADPDIVVASAKAYLSALNKLIAVEKLNPQTSETL